ncbi:hypothetical protein Xoosp13_11 [Xanthomonas phage Xoo-sp13]|nr:hypothetical protein Xoosp13_11 [Xanthomonas phage Xoo-sp13]
MTTLTAEQQLANLVKLRKFADNIDPEYFNGGNVQFDAEDASNSGCFIHRAFHAGGVLPDELQQSIYRIARASMFGRWLEVKALLPFYFGPGSDDLFNTTPRDFDDALEQLDSFINQFSTSLKDETEQYDINQPETPAAPKVTRHINAKGEAFDIIAHFDGTFSVYKLTAVIENRELQEMLIAVQ